MLRYTTSNTTIYSFLYKGVGHPRSNVLNHRKPFSSSNGYTHILVDVDYITKWVEAIPTSSDDHNTSVKMLKEIIFPRFGVPRYLMTDGGFYSWCFS